jgi:hypothetical protein
MQVVVNKMPVTIRKKQYPFSNEFTASEVKLNEDWQIELLATCTANSKEPGRIYKCYYTLGGTLLECYTIN